MSQKIDWKVNNVNSSSVSGALNQVSKLKQKIIISICLALLSTSCQFFIFHSFFKGTPNSSENNAFPVAVASQDIKLGDVLSEKNISFIYIDVPISRDHYLLESEFNSYIEGKFLIPAAKNTPITKNMIKTEFQKNSVSGKIPNGKRLFILDYDADTASLDLQVGDNVDIIAHMNIPQFGEATETILVGAEIIGIGKNSGENENSSNTTFNSLSFYVTLDEFKTLSFMKKYSQFSIALRNPNDTSTQRGIPMTLNKFLQDKRIKKIIKNDSFKIIKGENIENGMEDS